jgi:hypothetical protein
VLLHERMAVRQAIKLDVSLLSWLFKDVNSTEIIQRRMLGLLTNDESGRKRHWPNRRLSGICLETGENHKTSAGRADTSTPPSRKPQGVTATANFREMWIIFISCVYRSRDKQTAHHTAKLLKLHSLPLLPIVNTTESVACCTRANRKIFAPIFFQPQ